MAVPPTITDLAERLGVDPATPSLPGVLASAIDVQAQVLAPDVTYAERHHEACLRRAAFLYASIPSTLGVIDSGVGVSQYLPLYHPDWDMLETAPIPAA